MLSAQPAKPSHICGHMGCEASKSPPSAEHVQLTGHLDKASTEPVRCSGSFEKVSLSTAFQLAHTCPLLCGAAPYLHFHCP